MDRINIPFLICVNVFAGIFFMHCDKSVEVENDGPDETPLDHSCIPVNADSIILAWDKPLFDPDLVTHYDVRYRVYGDTSWHILFPNISATDNPSAQVFRSQLLQTGTAFEFSVRSIASSGSISPPHTSLDSLAFPAGGWYVLWKQQ